MQQGDIYAISAGLFWSVSVILMRVSGLSIPPVPLTFFKSFASVVCFIIALAILREPLWISLESKTYIRLIISAVLGISIADTMFVAALNRLGASLQALADCIYSPAIAGVGFLMFGEFLGPWELAGGALVVAGVAVGMRITAEVKSTRDLYIGVALAAGAHIIMAIGILMVRDVIREHSVVWVSGLRFLIATIVLGATAAFRMPLKHLFLGFSRRDTWKMTIPMAVLGPFAATLFWVAGFKYLTAGRAAIYNQLSTVFIILLAFVFLKEKLTMRKCIGLGLAVLGSLLVATH
ncbi:MAG: drug/metabolite transporter (DMT)-like permease [Verrucomicrobiales bacterium]|jgi:drug/metabolite transporter (DMT)-like permease